MNVLMKSQIITAPLFSIVIVILVSYLRFNLTINLHLNNVELNTQFGENEADERDVTYNVVTMPLQNLDGDETDEFCEVLNSQTNLLLS
jgi:hypothetical protein